MNKLFKISRIGSVEVLDKAWQHTDKHQEVYIDIFRMTGFTKHRVCLKLGMLAHNLLVEEYPFGERDITPTKDGYWMLDTEVCNYVGIGRFVLGLLDDIEIVDSPEFDEYITSLLQKYVDQRTNI